MDTPLPQSITKPLDHDPFGMITFGRSWEAGSGYRYGFNTQEQDDEVYGNGNLNAARFWEYDTRLGRRWNVDPVVKSFESPYATFSLNPIFYVDILGDKSDWYQYSENGETYYGWIDGNVGNEIEFEGRVFTWFSSDYKDPRLNGAQKVNMNSLQSTKVTSLDSPPVTSNNNTESNESKEGKVPSVNPFTPLFNYYASKQGPKYLIANYSFGEVGGSLVNMSGSINLELIDGNCNQYVWERDNYVVIMTLSGSTTVPSGLISVGGSLNTGHLRGPFSGNSLTEYVKSSTGGGSFNFGIPISKAFSVNYSTSWNRNYKTSTLGLGASGTYKSFDINVPASASAAFGGTTMFVTTLRPIDSTTVARLNMLDAYHNGDMKSAIEWGTFYHNVDTR